MYSIDIFDGERGIVHSFRSILKFKLKLKYKKDFNYLKMCFEKGKETEVYLPTYYTIQIHKI